MIQKSPSDQNKKAFWLKESGEKDPYEEHKYSL